MWERKFSLLRADFYDRESLPDFIPHSLRNIIQGRYFVGATAKSKVIFTGKNTELHIKTRPNGILTVKKFAVPTLIGWR
ncbi:hypothetical protein CH376_01630, partial [Leptospira adleri]